MNQTINYINGMGYFVNLAQKSSMDGWIARAFDVQSGELRKEVTGVDLEDAAINLLDALKTEGELE